MLVITQFTWLKPFVLFYSLLYYYFQGVFHNGFTPTVIGYKHFILLDVRAFSGCTIVYCQHQPTT
jgi:hypothetical protein